MTFLGHNSPLKGRIYAKEPTTVSKRSYITR